MRDINPVQERKYSRSRLQRLGLGFGLAAALFDLIRGDGSYGFACGEI